MELSVVMPCLNEADTVGTCVEKALRANGGEGLALDINAEGQSPLDAVVLAVVNALPAEARMKLEPGPAAPQPPETLSPAGDEPATDEQIEDLDARI